MCIHIHIMTFFINTSHLINTFICMYICRNYLLSILALQARTRDKTLSVGRKDFRWRSSLSNVYEAMNEYFLPIYYLYKIFIYIYIFSVAFIICFTFFLCEYLLIYVHFYFFCKIRTLPSAITWVVCLLHSTHMYIHTHKHIQVIFTLKQTQAIVCRTQTHEITTM